MSSSGKGEATGTISPSYTSNQDRSFHSFSSLPVLAFPTSDDQELALFSLNCVTLSPPPSSEMQTTENGLRYHPKLKVTR